ncbi:hypothetical protein BDN72DRAFT_860489 [Pluteus cervinus]|uniref:Uncharacterized protein n=1 Tax=Pluteus cervinus TaxID=181527 RepID=A0ACD3AKA0_9AGAR|nr:hypothetical protein BDN72DRAFT_860489 [Pluteus cervinus]
MPPKVKALSNSHCTPHTKKSSAQMHFGTIKKSPVTSLPANSVTGTGAPTNGAYTFINYPLTPSINEKTWNATLPHNAVPTHVPPVSVLPTFPNPVKKKFNICCETERIMGIRTTGNPNYIPPKPLSNGCCNIREIFTELCKNFIRFESLTETETRELLEEIASDFLRSVLQGGVKETIAVQRKLGIESCNDNADSQQAAPTYRSRTSYVGPSPIYALPSPSSQHAIVTTFTASSNTNASQFRADDFDPDPFLPSEAFNTTIDSPLFGREISATSKDLEVDFSSNLTNAFSDNVVFDNDSNDSFGNGEPISTVNPLATLKATSVTNHVPNNSSTREQKQYVQSIASQIHTQDPRHRQVESEPKQSEGYEGAYIPTHPLVAATVTKPSNIHTYANSQTPPPDYHAVTPTTYAIIGEKVDKVIRDIEEKAAQCPYNCEHTHSKSKSKLTLNSLKLATFYRNVVAPQPMRASHIEDMTRSCLVEGNMSVYSPTHSETTSNAHPIKDSRVSPHQNDITANNVQNYQLYNPTTNTTRRHLNGPTHEGKHGTSSHHPIETTNPKPMLVTVPNIHEDIRYQPYPLPKNSTITNQKDAIDYDKSYSDRMKTTEAQSSTHIIQLDNPGYNGRTHEMESAAIGTKCTTTDAKPHHNSGLHNLPQNFPMSVPNATHIAAPAMPQNGYTTTLSPQNHYEDPGALQAHYPRTKHIYPPTPVAAASK